jgi:uncharacterized protein (TIGR03118 family)
MGLNLRHALHDGKDLIHDAQMLVSDSSDDFGEVRLADLLRDLREHHPVTTFMKTNLVSDGLVSAAQTDPNLINPWGMSSSGTSPIWISQNGEGLTSLYRLSTDGKNTVTLTSPPPPATPLLLSVHVVTAAGVPLSPTGQVFNPFGTSVPTAFVLSNTNPSNPTNFMFATEEGTIEGWNPAQGSHTVTVAATPGAVYTGLGIDNVGDVPMLYAANFSQGKVDVFDSAFHQINTITDGHGPSGFAPFNAQVLTVPGVAGAPSVERLFVTVAHQGALTPGSMSDDGHGGFVDEFDLQGHLIDRIDSEGTLNTPWGLAIAPASFGTYAGDLLVGNHGDGTISVFDLNRHDDQALGHLLDSTGKSITIDDLWGLIPGNNTVGTSPAGAGGNSDTIYFTAGSDNGAHGLFGSLTANSTPLQVSMMGQGEH